MFKYFVWREKTTPCLDIFNFCGNQLMFWMMSMFKCWPMKKKRKFLISSHYRIYKKWTISLWKRGNFIVVAMNVILINQTSFGLFYGVECHQRLSLELYCSKSDVWCLDASLCGWIIPLARQGLTLGVAWKIANYFVISTAKNLSSKW
jgi:hypothetical protein